MRHILLILMIILATLGGQTASAAAASPEENFIAAGQAYRNADYAAAVRLYSTLINAEYVSGHVYYNLANAYLKQGDLGHAVLNYERAKELIPRDEDLNFNRGFARDKIRDAQTLQPGLYNVLFFWLESVTADELLLAFGIINALFFALLIYRIFRRPEWSFTVMIVLSVLWIMSGVSFALTWHTHATDTRAVVIASEASILSGPDTKETEMFKLHAGTIVETERTEGAWTLIRLSDEKRGWTAQGNIAMVRVHNPKQ